EQRAARLPSIKITVLLRGGSLELTVVNTGETITHIHAFYILHANGEKSTTERYAGGVTNAVAIQNGLQSGQMFKRQYAHFVTDPKTRSSREAGADSWKDAVAAVVEVNNKVFRCERADWVISN
ncbi:MAG: hypothetical protein Q8L55_12315, partial [Phycisphaerales bacterium]|nr:hypothetical protein [Phycisphaerales bacterium]